MDILFRRTYIYKSAASFEATKDKLQRLFTEKKWYDLSKDISGEIGDDGVFSFKVNYFISLMKFGDTVYLKGLLSKDETSTNIKITISPNLGIVLLIYVFILISLNVLFGDNSMMGKSGNLNNFFGAMLVLLIIVGITQINTFRLKRKFEETMGLNKVSN